MLRYIIGITLLTLGIIVIRALSNGKVQRKHQYAFWIAIPLYMLLMPFIKINIPITEANVLKYSSGTEIKAVAEESDPVVNAESKQQIQAESVNPVIVHEMNDGYEITQEHVQIPVQDTLKSEYKVKESVKVDSILMHVVFSVSAVLTASFITYNIIFITYCRRNRKYIGRDPASGLKIYSIRHKETPFLLFNKIYVDNDSEKISEYIICHEACHFKHGDYLWVLIRYLVLFLNWYNPFIWAAFIFSGRDCELACDEKVMQICGKEVSKDYARTLFELLEQQSDTKVRFVLSTGMKSGYKIMKKRIISIKRPANNSRKALALSMAALILFTSCSFAKTPDIRKIRSNDPWFNAQSTVIDDKFKNRKLDYYQTEICGVYKDGIILKTEGAVTDGSVFLIIDYYSFSGELICSVDAGDILINRELEDIIISDNGVDLRIRNAVYDSNSKEEKCYLANVDLVTGVIGELKEIKTLTSGFGAEGTHYYDTWIIGNHSVSCYRTPSTYAFSIKSNGNEKLVDLSTEMPYTSISFISGCIAVSDIEVLFVCLSNDVKFLSLDLETGKVENKDEEYSWLNAIDYNTDISSFDGNTYIADIYGVKRINLESKELEEIVSYNNCNINRYIINQMHLISVEGDRYIFAGMICQENSLEMRGNESSDIPAFAVIEKTETNPNAGKLIITAAITRQIKITYSICEAVRIFNATSTDYYIQFDNRYNLTDYVDYSNAQDHDDKMDIFYNGASALSNKLANDMISGTGPDILLDAGDFSLIQSEDCLLDLNSYIKGKTGINEADYFTNVIDAAKVDDKLLYMPVSFTISGIPANKSDIDDGQIGFTFEEYVRFLDEVYNGSDPMNDTRLGVICTLYSYMSDTCVNGKTVNFDNESFRALCEYVKYNVNDSSNKVIADDYDGTDYYSGFSNFLGKNDYNAPDKTLLGYPSTYRRGPEITVYTSIGISASAPSKVVDGAWEFIKLYLGDDLQKLVAMEYSNPVSKSAYDSTSSIALKNYNKAHSDHPLDEDIITSYKDILISASIIDNTDPAVLVVLREELPPYFLDQKSLDEVLPIINDRVSTIISERS